jgi:hypothetical protein
MNSELIELKKQFSAWRQTKTSRATPVPQELRAAAVGQLANHSLSKLCSELSLSRVMLLGWQAAKDQNSAVPQYTKIYMAPNSESVNANKIYTKQFLNNSSSLATLHFGDLKIEIQNSDALNSVIDKILRESCR